MNAPFHYRTLLQVTAIFALLLWSGSSYGQAVELAKKLLAEAKQQKDAGNVAAACPLLDRAYELDAKDGILFARADCRDQEGKIVIAVSLYEAYLRAYSRMASQPKQAHSERAATAEARIKELGPLVPHVKFVWAEQPPPETKIIVDGVEFSAATLDVRLPLEPGTHEIIVRLPDKPERKRSITLAKGGSTIVDLTPLTPSQLEALNWANRPKESSKSPVTHKPVSVKQPIDPWKVSGFVGVGLGIGGLIGGSIAGGMAISEKSIVDERCNAERRCDAEGLAAVDRFQAVGNASTALFVAGGVLAGVGATMLVIAYRPSSPESATARVRVTVLPGGTQVGIEGAF